MPLASFLLHPPQVADQLSTENVQLFNLNSDMAFDDVLGPSTRRCLLRRSCLSCCSIMNVSDDGTISLGEGKDASSSKSTRDVLYDATTNPADMFY